MASLRIRDLAKRYPSGTLALAGIDLDVADGELVVLLGPSGCGKTTLLRLIAGLEEPSTGTISIGDRPVDGLSPRERDVALVFQEPALYPHLTVRGNLEFGLRRRRVPRPEARRRAERVASTLGIAPLLDRRPAELSGGERRRVALGRALAREPAVFLLDEPLSGLDAPLRWELQRELRRLHRDFGRTTIHVTHDAGEAMSLADRIVVLGSGSIEQEGSPDEIYASPRSRFVAGLVGSPPMSFLSARVEAENEGALLRLGADVLRLPQALAMPARRHAGRVLVLGLRPDAVTVGRSGSDDAFLPAQVSAALPRGEGALLVCRLAGGAEVIATAARDTRVPGSGEEVVLALDMRRGYLFDPENAGWNIAREEPRAAAGGAQPLAAVAPDPPVARPRKSTPS